MARNKSRHVQTDLEGQACGGGDTHTGTDVNAHAFRNAVLQHAGQQRRNGGVLRWQINSCWRVSSQTQSHARAYVNAPSHSLSLIPPALFSN